MMHIEVAAAVFLQDNKVFAAQRKDFGELAKRWEFPGGKLEHDECGEQAIIREIQEELGVEIQVKRLLLTVEHQYATFSLTMHGYLCEILQGPLELREHLDSKWLAKADLYSVNWADADLPLVHAVSSLLE